jgi:hypothetical protein
VPWAPIKPAGRPWGVVVPRAIAPTPRVDPRTLEKVNVSKKSAATSRNSKRPESLERPINQSGRSGQTGLVMQRTRRVRIIKQRGWCAHKRLRSQPAPPDVAPVGQCSPVRLAGTQPRVLSEVPGAVLCLGAQGEGAFLRIAPQRYKSTNQRTR